MNGREEVIRNQVTVRLGRNVCPGNRPNRCPPGNCRGQPSWPETAISKAFQPTESPVTTGTRHPASASQAEGRGFETRRPLGGRSDRPVIASPLLLRRQFER